MTAISHREPESQSLPVSNDNSLLAEPPPQARRLPVPADAPLQEAPKSAGKAMSKRKLLLLAGAFMILSGGAYYGHDWWTVGRFIVATDDAYVAADSATVTPKIPGYVRSVAALENSWVSAGQPLVHLDDADNRIAVEKADAQVATQQAAIARLAQQVRSRRCRGGGRGRIRGGDLR